MLEEGFQPLGELPAWGLDGALSFRGLGCLEVSRHGDPMLGPPHLLFMAMPPCHNQKTQTQKREVLTCPWVAGSVISIAQMSTGIPGLPVPKPRESKETLSDALVMQTGLLEAAAESGQPSPSL